MSVNNYSEMRYLKDAKFLTLLIIFEIIHLILFVMPNDSVDWRIQWTAASYIVDGIPLYEQRIYSIPSEKLILPPHHFPLFFYMLAIVALTGSKLLGKLFLWFLLNIMVVAYFKVLKPDTNNEAIFLLAIIFLHPATIGISYFSTFDPLMATCMLLVYYVYRKEQYWLAGTILSISMGIKFLTVLLLVPISIQLLSQRQLGRFTKIVTSFVLTTLLQLVVYILIFDNFIRETLLWQYRRQDSGFAIWGHFFQDFFISEYFLLFQLSVLLAIVAILYAINTFWYRISFWSMYVIIVAMFIFVYRAHYGHYGFWLFIGLVPVYYRLYTDSKYSYLVLLLVINQIYYLGILSCGYSCFSMFTLSPVQQVLVILIALVLFLIPLAVLKIEQLHPVFQYDSVDTGQDSSD